MRSLCQFVVLLFLAPLLAAPVDVHKIDDLVRPMMKEYGAPGVAVGILIDGKVVLAKGYGVRSVLTRQPVTPDTVFAVGSVTKSFTGITVALAVDDRKLEWDRPVREYLPWFRMYDPVATELITPRDLLTHRSGLPRHDFIRFSTPLSRAELVRRIRYLPNNRTFRDVYQYNNLMFVTAGFLAGEVTGTTWEDMVRSRIFKPLGMSNSTVAVADSQKLPDFARPHETNGESKEAKEVPFYDYQRFGVGPNGAVNSSVNDLLRYAQFYLDPNQKLLTPAQRRELWRPVTVAGDGGYALGWQVGFLRGHKIVEHSGSITGFSAHLSLLPDDKIAIVVLNNTSNSLPTLTAHGIADRVLGLEPTDRLAQLRQQRNASGNSASAMPVAVPNTRTSMPLSAYVGDYVHPAYGAVKVTQKGDRLEVAFAALTVSLQHFHYDTFEFGESGGDLAEFLIDQKGQVATLLLPLEPTVKPLPFERVR